MFHMHHWCVKFSPKPLNLGIGDDNKLKLSFGEIFLNEAKQFLLNKTQKRCERREKGEIRVQRRT